MIRAQTCPICEKELPLREAGQFPAFFPFCSERCKQVDLFRWNEGKYAIVDPMKPDDLDAAEFPDDDID